MKYPIIRPVRKVCTIRQTIIHLQLHIMIRSFTSQFRIRHTSIYTTDALEDICTVPGHLSTWTFVSGEMLDHQTPFICNSKCHRGWVIWSNLSENKCKRSCGKCRCCKCSSELLPITIWLLISSPYITTLSNNWYKYRISHYITNSIAHI